jgi:two-component system, sensor histidine kinase PdtaS
MEPESIRLLRAPFAHPANPRAFQKLGRRDAQETSVPMTSKGRMFARWRKAPDAWADWRHLLTAYFFSWTPLVVLFVVSLSVAHYAGRPELGAFTHNAPPFFRLSIELLLSAAIILSTYRIRGVLTSVNRTQELYHIAMVSASEGIVIMTRTGQVLEANTKALEVLNCEREDLLKKDFWSAAKLVNRAEFTTMLLRMSTGKAATLERRLVRPDGTPCVLDLSARLDSSRKVIAILRDITERKNAEEAMRTSEKRYRMLFERNLGGVYILSVNGLVLDCNDSFAHTLGYESGAELVGRPAAEYFHDAAQHKELVRQLKDGAKLINCEMAMRKKDNSQVWVLTNISKVRATEDDATVSLLGTAVDITENRLAAEQMKASLGEKEVLLKEIHHRVKNNLQIISSLLSLQAGYIKDPDALNKFRESTHRIRSISLIHESLYQSKDLAQVDFGMYVKKLAENLIHSYGRPGSIKLEVDVEGVSPNLDVAIPCGLIINELICNALKYAFPQGEGSIAVRMTAEPGGTIVLTVKDDGIGFPPHVDFGGSATLGLQLVKRLAGQLRGVAEVFGGAGTEFRVTFPGRAGG